jgi:aspartyl-tRNA(Asn)/glutamyl-tRNA(Gln) amidotransferase subunit A
MKNDIHYLSIRELSKRIQEQKISPVEVVDICLNRIEALNPELNAFITVLKKEAREQAKEAEAEIQGGKWRGPLHGIPVGVKDFYDTKDIKTTAAFQNFKDRIPKKDAESVALLKQAGAILIGKMNMHQLGMGTTGLESFFGPVHNPWNKNYVPGGSSSGSAAAVASGLCYATLDTDAIGSCRLPAACCGVVGFKATYDLISTKGILDGEQPPDEMIVWLSHAAITTRNVEDTAIVLSALVGKNNQTDYSPLLKPKKELRIGAANNFQADTEVRNAFQKTIATLKDIGYTVKQVALPFIDLRAGIKNIETDRRTIADKTFRDVDILLLPTTTTTTPLISDAHDPQALSPENTAFANYYSLPAISVTAGFDSNQLPIGVQMIGKPGDEPSVLQLANVYQLATPFHTKHPVP